MTNPSTDDILRKYGAKIESQMKGYDAASGQTKKFSQSYEKFKSSMLPEFSRYERWCKAMGNFIAMKVGEKDRTRIQKDIDIAHLNVTPSEVVAFSTTLLLLTLFGGIMAAVGGVVFVCCGYFDEWFSEDVSFYFYFSDFFGSDFYIFLFFESS